MSEVSAILTRVQRAFEPDPYDLVRLLALHGPAAQELWSAADEVRRRHMGDGVLLRGIVEFSNRCSRGCLYCGLRAANREIHRYEMSFEEILASVREVARCGIRTVVLQSGEDDQLDPEWLARVIRAVKAEHEIAVTLSVGEKERDVYALLSEAGADRYLLRIETSRSSLYRSLHPNMDFEKRCECLRALRELGYQVGSGVLVGLWSQTLEDLAGDIVFFKRFAFDMIGLGPFIAHPFTPCAGQKNGDPVLTLNVLALARVVTQDVHLVATTAIGSLGSDYRPQALQCGANVLMPNFTPQPFRSWYEIYPDKRCVSESVGACVPCLRAMTSLIGRSLDFSRGDSLKMKV